MCQANTGRMSPGTEGCACGCCGPSFRRYFSPEEERECLETYRDQLKKELAGVEARVKELGGK